MKKNNTGFSLTEVSIVLVIISLIIAASLQGQHLIKSAKVRAISSESTTYKVAINNFIAKYDQYPGDFSEAVARWGAGTANGDNNGQIEFVNTDTTPVYEGYRAWQHLGLSKMLSSDFAGTKTTAVAVLETDVPKSKSRGGYLLDYGVFALSDYNVLVLGKPVATTTSPILVDGILSPEEAFAVDSKLDDGDPNNGSVRGKIGNGSSGQACILSGTLQYNQEVGGLDCTLGFKLIQQ